MPKHSSIALAILFASGWTLLSLYQRDANGGAN